VARTRRIGAFFLEREETHNAIEVTGRLPRRGAAPSLFEPGEERGSNRVTRRSARRGVLAVLFGPGVVRGSNEDTGREPGGKRAVVLFGGACEDDASGPTRRGRVRARVTLVGPLLVPRISLTISNSAARVASPLQ
jgi:hypothetical protein